jgi:hypothetical protein
MSTVGTSGLLFLLAAPTVEAADTAVIVGGVAGGLAGTRNIGCYSTATS